MKDLTFNTTQFLLVIILNLVLFSFWYFTTPVRIVNHTETKTVYKDRVVKVDDKTERYKQLLESVTNTCQKGYANGVIDFRLDENDKPVFKCHF